MKQHFLYLAYKHSSSLMVILGLVALSIVGFTIAAHALTLEWDRNGEADLKDYRVYLCTGTGCALTKTDALLIGTVPQSLPGVKPSIVLPDGTEGNTAVTARDLSLNESGLSVIVPFDHLPPTIPANPHIR